MMLLQELQETSPPRDDGVSVEVRMAAVVMGFDLLHVNGLPYAHHVVPAVKAVEAPKVEVKAAPAPVLYAAGYPHVYAAHHVLTHPVTYTHTVPAGVLTHTVAGHPVVGGVLPAFAPRTVAIAAPAAAEAVVDA